MGYPQKLILSKPQREVIYHRLTLLESLTVEELAELWHSDEPSTLDFEAMSRHAHKLADIFRGSAGHLISICVESEEQAELLAETLEGCTYFGTHVKGDAVYRHAARTVAELLTTVMGREVTAHIDPIP